jgi:putative hydrolase of the HAD superfamily
MTLPRAILFDLDDTIISAYPQPSLAWNAVATELAHELAPLTVSEVVDTITQLTHEYWNDAARAQAGRRDLQRARRQVVASALAQLAAEGRPAIAAEAAIRLADRFTDYRVEQMRLFPGAHETIDALKNRGVKLALVTNGDTAGQRAKLARFALATRFDHVQIEEEAGFGKPDERAYLQAMRALGVVARDTWMVGDNLEWEVAVPQRLGIYAIWHDALAQGLPAGSTIKPNRIIRELSELLLESGACPQ